MVFCMTEADKKKIVSIMEKHGVLVGYLFGSAARGTMGPHSDIDVAVLFDKNKVPQERQFDEELSISGEIARALNVEDADVVNLGTVRNPLLKHIVASEGILVLMKDRDKYFLLERSIIQEYEDSRFLHNTAVRIMREQIKDGTFGKASMRVL